MCPHGPFYAAFRRALLVQLGARPPPLYSVLSQAVVLLAVLFPENIPVGAPASNIPPYKKLRENHFFVSDG